VTESTERKNATNANILAASYSSISQLKQSYYHDETTPKNQEEKDYDTE
jgi:hypothetical protein